MKKNKLFTIFLFLVALFSLMISAVTVSATTESMPEKVTLTSFKMDNGAQFRIVEPYGIRFIASISKEDYKLLNDTYDTVEYGMMIARGNDVEQLKTHPETMIKSKTWYDDYNPDNTAATEYIYHVAVYGIKDVNFNSQYVALGYAKCTFGQNDPVYYYTTYDVGQNVRTPLQVVSKFKADGLIEDTEIDNYVNAIIDTAIGEKTVVFENATYTVAVGDSIDVKVLLDGKPVNAVLSFGNDNACLDKGKVKGAFVGTTTVTATISGATKDYTATATVNVIKKDKTLSVAMENGVATWEMEDGTTEATVTINGEVASNTANGSFDVADYLKKNGYTDGEENTIAIDNSTASANVTGATTFTINNIDDVSEFLAVDGEENKYYVLTNNIDLLDSVPSVIVNGDTSDAYMFMKDLKSVVDMNGYGIYNVNGETVKNEKQFKGLFHTVHSNGVIKNGYIEGSIVANWDYSSLISSTFNGVLENCLLAPSYSVSNGSNWYSTHTIFHQFNGEIHNVVIDYSNADKNTIFDYSGVADNDNITDVIMVYKQSLQGVLGTWAYANLNSNRPMLSFTNVTRYNMMTRLFDPSGKALGVNEGVLTETETTENVHENWSDMFEFNTTDKKVYTVNANGKNPCLAPTIANEVNYASVEPNVEVTVQMPTFNEAGVEVSYDVVNANGESVKATYVTGNVFKSGDSGVYTFIYTAVLNGRKLVYEVDLIVSNVTLSSKVMEVVVANGKTNSQMPEITLAGDYTETAFSYKSNDTSIVTVDEQGKLTYVKGGNTTVTATHIESGMSIDIAVKSYSKYIAITDVTSFLSIDGADSSTYCELLNPLTITDSDKHYTTSSYTVTEVGTRTAQTLISTFNGVFDGNGNTLTINRSIADTSTLESAVATGIFGRINSNAVIRNTIFAGKIVVAYTRGFTIADWVDGTIENCVVGIDIGAYQYTDSGNYQAMQYIRNAKIRNCIFSGKLLLNDSSSSVRSLQMFNQRKGSSNVISDNFMISSYSPSSNLVGYIDRSNFKVPTHANCSNYSSFDNLLLGTGYLSVAADDSYSAKTFTTTAITETPQYLGWSYPWAFTSTSITLCGKTVYSK